MEKSKHEKYLPFLQEHTDEIWSEPLFNLWNVQFTKVPRYLYLSNNEDNINVVFDASNYCKCSQIIRHNNIGFRIEKGVKHTFEYGSSKNGGFTLFSTKFLYSADFPFLSNKHKVTAWRLSHIWLKAETSQFCAFMPNLGLDFYPWAFLNTWRRNRD